jgi:hydrogenase/urease accessory protein HupE
MRHILAVCLLLTASGATAHPGHIADVAGHGHWVAGAAIGAAIALGLWEALKGRRKAKAEKAETHDEDEEAAA